MSRDSPSPSDRNRLSASLSPVSIVIDLDHGSGDGAKIPLLSSPLLSPPGTASGRESSSSHVAIEMHELDKPPGAKHKAKRKDTATSSISSFIHRITQGRSSSDVNKPDEKDRLTTHKGDAVVEEEDEVVVHRPDTLQIPEKEEQWFESRTSFEQEAKFFDGWKTALTPGPIAPFPFSLRESTPLSRTHTGASRLNSGETERSTGMEKLLEDFRSGTMSGISKEELAAMEATRRAHELITDNHVKLAVAEMEGELTGNALSSAFNNLYDAVDIVHDHLRKATTATRS